jgi:Flavoprotein.
MEHTIPQDVLRRILQSILPVLNKRVLVLFTGGSADADGLMDSVESLLATRAMIAISPAFARLAPEAFLRRVDDRLVHDENAMRNFIADSHLTVVPILTRNTLVKAALGIQDSLVTNAIAATLMRGISLIAINENYHPHSAHSQEKGYSANTAYNELLVDYERRLRALGATIVAGSEFSGTVKGTLYPGVFSTKRAHEMAPVAAAWRYSGETVLTQADIPSLSPGAAIEVPTKTVITPLAMERIASQKLILIRPS